MDSMEDRARQFAERTAARLERQAAEGRAMNEEKNQELIDGWTRSNDVEFDIRQRENELIPIRDMMERCVYVALRDEVVTLPPEGAEFGGKRLTSYPFKIFTNLNNGNWAQHPFKVDRDGNPVMVNTAIAWSLNPDRWIVTDVCNAVGYPRFIHTPEGELAVNLWTPYVSIGKSHVSIQPFLDHVAYLIPEPRQYEKFLDWLAHCEQRPYELPHYGWLFFAKNFGIGRSVLTEILAKVWRGEVATSIDITKIVGSFNDEISCRRMAVVDEVHIENHRELYQISARLRQLMTEQFRYINPKYGRKIVEYNVMRWIILSNHENALPMPDGDRRLEVVENPTEPKDADYYIKMYRLRDDPAFIAAVRNFLACRDISFFNPGEPPEMSVSKLKVIAASKSGLEKEILEVLQEWKKAGIKLFCSNDLIKACEIEPRHQKNAMPHILERAGCVRFGERRKVLGARERLFAMSLIDAEILSQDETFVKDAISRIATERGEGGLFNISGAF